MTFLTLGRERKFRERLLVPARLQQGESVLDIGCGTGTLAMAAASRVGASGSVTGIDPSAAMIARARHKARRAGLNATFDVAFAQSLPFADAHFDAVLSTLMLHHLPRAAREDALREVRRVLKPGGRVIAVDFGSEPGAKKGLLGHIHGHSGFTARYLVDLVGGAGLDVADSGSLGTWDLQYVVGRRAS